MKRNGHAIDLTRYFGGCVRHVRKARLMPQHALAGEVEISEVSLRNIEYGISWPKAATIERLAAALGVPPARLFPLTPEVDPRMRLFTAIVGMLSTLNDRDLALAHSLVTTLATNSRETPDAKGM